LTFYGGVDEIGGNKILLQDRGTKIFLDFGMSFALKKQYYSLPFLSPRSDKSLQELGILRNLKAFTGLMIGLQELMLFSFRTPIWITQLTYLS
jgi:predicted metal-dependent RNase